MIQSGLDYRFKVESGIKDIGVDLMRRRNMTGKWEIKVPGLLCTLDDGKDSPNVDNQKERGWLKGSVVVNF